MANTNTITIVISRPRQMLMPILFWGSLLGAEWFTRWAFGGSFLVDCIVLIGIIAGLSMLGIAKSGLSVAMDRRELKRWVDDGMPRDVQAWRASKKAVATTGEVIQ